HHRACCRRRPGRATEPGDGARWDDAAGGVDAHVVTSGRSCSSLAGPMPRTEPRSSTAWNGPWASRYATIAAAVDGPMPGSVSRSSAVAVLTSSGWSTDGAALDAPG